MHYYWLFGIALAFALILLFLLTLRIVIFAYNENTDIYVFLSVRFLYFFELENVFVYCRMGGKMKGYLFGKEVKLLKLRKKRRKQSKLTVRPKRLDLTLAYGNKNAAATALIAGALQAILSIIAIINFSYVSIHVIPEFSAPELKIVLRGCLGLKFKFQYNT